MSSLVSHPSCSQITSHATSGPSDQNSYEEFLEALLVLGQLHEFTFISPPYIKALLSYCFNLSNIPYN
ncbi:hypothetical protein I79_022914 [Cricetulus griseus]|uniref:Uncharacterized protein n=1 Tax=Cricetulus griseus TaxID=10029 RepID=G3IGJ7_CRIGR|nr:hypothetical protein I79_022914 [Cricetulus griseus]